MPILTPPMAPRRPHRLVAHGQVREDDWYWLADRSDPEVLAYLRAENDYADAVLAPTVALQNSLFEQIKTRVVETDVGPPTRHGTWWYWSRTLEGRQYRMLCRRPDPARSLRAEDVVAAARAGGPLEETGEQVLLDENLLAGDSAYFAVGVLDVSPDQRTLAYATDLDGSESYILRFRDLETGRDRADVIEGVYYGSAWATDNQTFFYVRPDDAMRPWQVWRHRVGGEPVGDGAGPLAGDTLVYQEDDERFFVSVELSRSQQCVIIHSSSKTTSEALWIDAASPDDVAQIVLPRQTGVEYDAEHDGDGWLIRTNRAEDDATPATNFALYRLAAGRTQPSDLVVVLPHRQDVMLESVDAFADHIVVAERSQDDGLERIRILGRAGDRDTVIDQPEPVYSLAGESNPEWDATTYRFGYTSLITPASSVDLNLSSLERQIVWTQPVLGGYDPAVYQVQRLWATASDGARIPISMVAPHDQPVDGTAPCLLYGYGAYELTSDPTFSLIRLNLLERGVTFAIAHVRGGGELGRKWYEQGRMEHKVNTFTDFIAAATHLVDNGHTSPDRLAARGASAGGLLMGAVANLRPDLWRAIVAEVPFVDVVTTMSDTNLPLTVTEWEEWGDPVHDPEAYQRMLSYSPYDNVPDDNVMGADYPAMFVTAGLNDPRVGYWEPAKWVAKLRSVGAGTTDRPLLLRTELGAGHQGSSGRYDAWRDKARVQAFLLAQLGRA